MTPKDGIHRPGVPARSLSLVAMAVLLTASIPSWAQQADMSSFIGPLAKDIAHSNKRRVLVLPLVCDDKKNQALGDFLARKIETSLASLVPGLEIIDSGTSRLPIERSAERGYPAYDVRAKDDLAKRAGAEFVVEGNFAPFGEGLGVSLAAYKERGRKFLWRNDGSITLTTEMAALVPQPLHEDPPADGIYRAGWGGVSIPNCLKCSDPSYSEQDRRAGVEGKVVLSMVVTGEGKPGQVVLVKSLSRGLDERSIARVMTWKFKPARGPAGVPVSVRVPVEITFHLF